VNHRFMGCTQMGMGGLSCVWDAVSPRLRLPCMPTAYKGVRRQTSWVQASLDQTPVLPMG
jgi:hypothetical protein